MTPFFTILAQAGSDIVGEIRPDILPGPYRSVTGGGLVLFFSNVLRLFFTVAGAYAFINFVLAGYQFMNAGGDAKAIGTAWKRIWQSLVGLVLIVGSFALASLFGQLIFGDPGFILSPKIFGPGTQ